MIRQSQIEKLLRAQREHDDTVSADPLDLAGRHRTIAVIGAAFRAASKEEQIEFGRRRRSR